MRFAGRPCCRQSPTVLSRERSSVEMERHDGDSNGFWIVLGCRERTLSSPALDAHGDDGRGDEQLPREREPFCFRFASRVRRIET